MKTLYLIRHAKSSWAFNLPDHDRPLGRRGRKDVMKVGKYLSDKHPAPEVIISSTASRAFYTALHMCDAYGIDEGIIHLNKELFHAGSEQILKVIQSARNCDYMAVFGHNPGFTQVANLLSNSNIDNVPTCGVVGITFDVKKWSKVSFGAGEKLFFTSPKKL